MFANKKQNEVVEMMPPGRKTEMYYVKYNRKLRWKNRIRRRRRQPDSNQKLLAELDAFLSSLGGFINRQTSRDMTANTHAWNRMIWQHRREIVNFIDVYSRPIPISVFPEPEPEPEVRPPQVRRARRPIRPFADSLAHTPEERCKICMVNKKTVGFFPCGHVGMCNECCKNTYGHYFGMSNKTKRPVLLPTHPSPPSPREFNFENEEEFIEEIINELTRPRFRHSQRCVFCKDRIESFNMIYSI